MKNQSFSCQIAAYTSGAKLLKANQHFDLIFLDIQMRGLSGLEAAKKLRLDGIDRYLVNLEYVCGYEDGLAHLESGQKIPVSRLLGQEFSQKMLRHMKKNGCRICYSLKIPYPCAVDDLDLCVLFSNAVDNAIRACGKLKSETRYIHISGKGDFFMVEFENSCAQATSYKKGIGLSKSLLKNIKEP